MSSGASTSSPKRSRDEIVAEATRLFEAFLRHRGLKQTRQRKVILEAFLDTDEHLTAEDLYRMVQERDSAIGFATVYRSLHLMVEAGIAREREFSAGRKFYEHVVGESQDHHHLICIKGGPIVEFYLPDSMKRELEKIADEHGFVLTDYTLELFGVSPEKQGKDGS